MEANNNWAPPTIGDIRLPDRDLGRRLSRQASVEMRAKMIGLDWTTLRASRSRLLLGAWLITGLASLVAIAINGTVPVGGVLGVTIAVVAIAAAASMLSLRSVSHLPVLIARNDPSLAARYTSLARLAPSQSLLGYRVRWILLRHAITTICSIAIVALMARGF